MSFGTGSTFLLSETINDIRILDSPVVIRDSQRVVVNGVPTLQPVTIEISATGTLICRALVIATATSQIELHRP